MSANRTAEEAEQDYIDKMGEPLGSLYARLWQEVAQLHQNWQEYIELYGTTPKRIDLLNAAAPLFFRLVQNSLWEGTLLHLARLTDPPETGKKSNLTIKRLPELIDDPDAAKRVLSLINKADEATGFCRDWRNRHIAHRDLDLALENGITPLKSASRLSVKEALKAVAEVLRAVSLHTMDTDILFNTPASPYGAGKLIYVIHDGLEVTKKRPEKFERGEYNPTDFDSPDL